MCEINNDARCAFGNDGACEAIFSMIQSQATNMTVLGYSMGPFRYIGIDNVDNCVKLRALGVFDTITRVLSILSINDM